MVQGAIPDEVASLRVPIAIQYNSTLGFFSPGNSVNLLDNQASFFEALRWKKCSDRITNNNIF